MRADGLDRLERGDTMAALEFARGKVSGAGSASYLLGMNRSPLASRMRALGIGALIQDYLGHRDPKHTVHYTRTASYRFEGLRP